MKFIGPPNWVDWMNERTASLQLPQGTAAICLNYDRSFRQRISETVEALSNCEKVFILSAGRLEELRNYAELEIVLDSPKVEFVQSPDRSLIELLRNRYPSRNPQLV